MRSDARSVTEYVASLPSDRRKSIEILRKLLRTHLDPVLEEVMQYGMITWVVPHRVYPAGYHCQPTDPLPVVSLASQKNNLALYLMPLYGDPQLSTWFDAAWKKSGYRLDRGKSCVRFRSLEEIPLDVVAELLKKINVPAWIRLQESQRRGGAGNANRASSAAGEAAGSGKVSRKPQGGVTTKKTSPTAGTSKTLKAPAGNAAKPKKALPSRRSRPTPSTPKTAEETVKDSPSQPASSGRARAKSTGSGRSKRGPSIGRKG